MLARNVIARGRRLRTRALARTLRSAAERFLGMTTEKIKDVIFLTLEGHLRAILGTLTVEEINADLVAYRTRYARGIFVVYDL